MTGSWFKFDEELGLGTEREASVYAAVLNAGRNFAGQKPILLNQAQAAGLIVLVTMNTFIIGEALAAVRALTLFSPDRLARD